MTDFAPLLRPDRGEPAHRLHLVDKAGAEAWIARQSPPRRALLEAMRFDGKAPHRFAILPGEKDDFDIVAAVANRETLTPWCIARLGEALPQGTYRLAEGAPGVAALGWLLAQHRFDRYRSVTEPDRGARVLLTSDASSIDRIVAEARATALVRDMVDTPASDLGPAELEAAVRKLGEECGAKVEVTHGDRLDGSFPMIAAVGRGAARDRAPRLIELHWGRTSDPPHRHHRQGRVLRQRRARHQAG